MRDPRICRILLGIRSNTCRVKGDHHYLGIPAYEMSDSGAVGVEERKRIQSIGDCH